MFKKLIIKLIKWLINLTQFREVPADSENTDSNDIPIYAILYEKLNRLLIYKPNDIKYPWKEIEGFYNNEEPIINNMIFAGQYNGPSIGYRDLESNKTILSPVMICTAITGEEITIGESNDNQSDLLSFLGINNGIIIGIEKLTENNKVFSFNINIRESDKGILAGDNYTQFML